MRILLVGGEEEFLEKLMSILLKEGHRVILLHEREDKCRKITEKFGIEGYIGDIADEKTLRTAKADKMDCVIVLSKNDSKNFTTGMVAKNLGARNVIVRLSDESLENVAIDHGLLVAVESELLLSKVMELLYRIEKYSVIDGMKIFKIKIKTQPKDIPLGKIKGNGDIFFIFAIIREGNVIFYDKDITLKAGDILLIATPESIEVVKKNILAALEVVT